VVILVLEVSLSGTYLGKITFSLLAENPQSENDFHDLDFHFFLKRPRRLLLPGTSACGDYRCYWWTSW
jgi:hypothetical protein